MNDLQFHLRDNKLHIVAAPGAGKTTLGIEIIARLNRPALVLCPTNTIKTQWQERVCDSFLAEDDYGLVSTNIREPRFITISTYQALLASFCSSDEAADEDVVKGEVSEESDDEDGEKEGNIRLSGRFKKDKADEIINNLRNAGISLICYDEAHHLRKEWWKALTFLNDNLKPKQTLALTATPPYDVDLAEWKRYQTLCGEIDACISIPELVKNGDLCPHQDFIHFSTLRDNERTVLYEFRRNIEKLMGTLTSDTELHDSLEKMEILEAYDSDVETILDSPEFYVSIASLLHSKGYAIPSSFLSIFDSTQDELPQFDYKQASVFFNGFFSNKKEEFKSLEQKKTYYLNLAKRLGLIHNNRMAIQGSQKVCKLMAGSLGKLDSILDIVKLEHSQLQERLRMVILADRIKADDTEGKSLGVVPIWAKVASCYGNQIPIGVLCGTLILLPITKKETLKKVISDNGIVEDAVTLTDFKNYDNYIRVIPKDSIRNHIVSIVTEMFNKGDITLLIGTQSLLGEGWDAPSINSLVLSSTVSSYMLSNQMRGRAIRIDKNNPDKVSNIWHLATVDFPRPIEDIQDIISLSPAIAEDEEQLCDHDIRQLAVRFQGYEAPSYYGKHEIKSGIERLLKSQPFLEDIAFKQMLETCRRIGMNLAMDRNQTRRWWKDALALGYGNSKVISGVQSQPLTVKSLRFRGYEYVFLVIMMFALFLWITQIKNSYSSDLMLVATASVIVVSVLSVWKYAISYLRTGTIHNVMKQVAIVVLETMAYQDIIKTSIHNVGLFVEETDVRELFVTCSNLPEEENALFIRSLLEVLNPIENPKYILIRENRLWHWFKQTDYFAVPSVIARYKSGAEQMALLWEKYIGPCKLIYTRTAEGRKLLLKARRDASSSLKRTPSKRLSKWQ